MATREEDTLRSSQLARPPRSGAHLEQTLFVSILIVFDSRPCFPQQEQAISNAVHITKRYMTYCKAGVFFVS
jgi:hypothetical protein